MAETEILESSQVDPAHASTLDLDAASPHGQPCQACGCPVEPMDKFCPACGTANVVEAEVVSQDPPDQRFLRCDNCGSEVAMDLDQRSYVCAFCDSTYVVEFSPDQTERQPPEFVIGFAVTGEQAQEKFRHWISENAWFRPADLKIGMVADKLQGVYLPFWSFSMLTESSWSANVGEYWYRTETYVTTDSKGKPVTRTRRVRETEWWPLSGNHHHYQNGFLVSGSKGLAQRDAERIKPFNLPALKRYEPYYLAGWLSEEYSIQREHALKACQDEFNRRERRQVARFLPGDIHRNVQVSTSFSNVNSDLCLLPVYILSYRYRDRLYRFLLNGQTGKLAGDKPVSWQRVLALVGVILLLILLIIGTGMLIAHYVRPA